MFNAKSPLEYFSWVVVGTYLLARGLYVMLLVPLAGGLANPLARDLRWLYLIEILSVVCLFWRPWSAPIIAIIYFILMSIVWVQFNSTGIGQFFHDRTLDFCFIGAICIIAWLRHSSS